MPRSPIEMKTERGALSCRARCRCGEGRQLQQVFNQMINQWAVQQSRPGGLLHRMSTG